MAELRNQRILITGASSGIGRALAVTLATHGARLAVAARRESELHNLADEVGGATVLRADLSRPGAPAELAERAVAALGGVDILINNAGVSVVGAQSRLGDDEAARTSFETNFWAPLALTRAIIPGMKKAGHGTIVNVTSTIQAVPLPLVGYYGAAKAALGQATRSLRHELRHTPIRVVEVVPGSTDTALRDIDQIPWRGQPPRTLSPVPPEAVAEATVRALRNHRSRIVHPAYSLLPLELPFIGRLVASVAARRIRR